MNINSLDKRIEFLSMDDKKDEDGYPIKKETIIRKCWASVRGLRGKTFYSAAAVQAEKNKVFNCRYFKELDEKNQIRYNNKIYEIESINDLNEKHIEYEIHAKEVKRNG